MRNLTSGNKINFTIFALIVLIILIILCTAVIMVVRTDKEEYPVSNTMSIYDKDYNYIELENDAKIFKKWTGNYYLKEDTTKKEYNLGGYAIAFDKNKKTLDLYGNFYQVLKGGDISKISGINTVSGNVQSQFYKIDDRKYLIAARNITNDTGSLSTQSYLIIIIDKLGNALLLNNKINAKTINEMIISTDDFKFDVANEILTYNDENINLKKIIGSTNEYVKREEENTTEGQNEVVNETEVGQVENAAGEGQITTSATTTTTTTQNDNNKTTIIQNGANNNNNNKQDTSWVGSLNNWIQKVAAGFQSIYNGNSGKKDEASLTKSIALNSLSVGTTSLDINYAITDPENKYNVVYAIVSDGTKQTSISLDKNATSYKVTGLEPNTNYSVEIGYKVIYSDSSVDEKVEDTMTVRTKAPTESLEITKVSTDKIYYTLKLDSNFVYDKGAKIIVYLNDTNEDTKSSITLTEANLEKAASSGYSGSFIIPDEYKIKGSSIKIKLENTKYNGAEVNTNLTAKIINY